MNISRRKFMSEAGLFAGAGLFLPSLLAAMKYDKRAF